GEHLVGAGLDHAHDNSPGGAASFLGSYRAVRGDAAQGVRSEAATAWAILELCLESGKPPLEFPIAARPFRFPSGSSRMLGIFAPFRACPPRTHSTSGAKSGLDHRLAPFVRQVDALDAFVVGRQRHRHAGLAMDR